MARLSSVLPLIALAVSASAHTIFQQLYVNGVSPGKTVGIRVPNYDGPITDVTSNDVICNGGINPFQTPVSTTVIPVPAGAEVTAEFHHTLNGLNSSDTADPIDPSHKGPVLAYLAKVNNATQSSVTGLQWFKIYHDGLTGSTWGVDRLISNKGKVSFTIPSCISAGQYLLRVEAIALHGASNYPGAQLYMECAQIQITGGGSTSPATVSFPGAYKGTDPGIKVNIYGSLPTYTIPGPAPFSCNGASSPPVPPPVPAPAPAPVQPSPPSIPVQPSPVEPSGPAASHYAQCGGTGFTGPTACVTPFTCQVSNQYYSQCL